MKEILKVTAQANFQTSSNEQASSELNQRALETYQKLRNSGLSDTDVMAFAGELLSLVALGVRSQAAAE